MKNLISEKMKKIIYYLSVVITISLFASCASKEKIVQYQNIENLPANTLSKFHTTLEPDDLLMIIVSAQDPIAAQPFNLVTNFSVNPNNQSGGSQAQQQLYLVDNKGFIDFPVIGKVEVAGKTREQVVSLLEKEISKYISKPIINLRIMNYQVTVQGEVVRPGVHTINSERISLPEALTLSGDVTIYGNRKNILIIREENGSRSTHRVDITKSDFLDSPFYYLKQNDIVYVEPNKVKMNSSAVGPNVSTMISVVSLLITILALAIKK